LTFLVNVTFIVPIEEGLQHKVLLTRRKQNRL